MNKVNQEPFIEDWTFSAFNSNLIYHATLLNKKASIYFIDGFIKFLILSHQFVHCVGSKVSRYQNRWPKLIGK